MSPVRGQETKSHSWCVCASRRSTLCVLKNYPLKAPQKIHRIYAPSDTPSLSLLVSPSGDVTVADGDLNIHTSQAYSDSSASVRKSFVFSQPSCSFLSGGPSSRCAVVLFLIIGECLQLHVLTAGEDGLEIVFDDAIPLQDHVRLFLTLSFCVNSSPIHTHRILQTSLAVPRGI